MYDCLSFVHEARREGSDNQILGRLGQGDLCLVLGTSVDREASGREYWEVQVLDCHSRVGWVQLDRVERLA